VHGSGIQNMVNLQERNMAVKPLIYAYSKNSKISEDQISIYAQEGYFSGVVRDLDQSSIKELQQVGKTMKQPPR